MASFREWLCQFRRDDTALGDLARDAAADPAWPASDDLEVVFLHLVEVGAYDSALEALDVAWTRWADGR